MSAKPTSQRRPRLVDRPIDGCWGSLLVICLVFAGGCYDLSLETDDHTITDLSILAIHVEPPVLSPDTPQRVTALVADPDPNGLPLETAWRVRYHARDWSELPAAETVAPRRTPLAPLVLPPYRGFRWLGKDASPLMVLDVFTCRGRLGDLGLIGTVSTEALFDRLCQGELVTGIKFVPNERWLNREHFGVDLGFFENAPRMAQQNPRVDRVTLNGELLTPVREGGGVHRVAVSERATRLTLRLVANLDPESVDEMTLFGLMTDGVGGYLSQMTDAGVPDAGADHRRFQERHIVDWYVTGGRLARPTTAFPAGLDTTSSMSGPFENLWYVERAARDKEYHLYVVARDERGGNGWQHLRIVIGPAK